MPTSTRTKTATRQRTKTSTDAHLRLLLQATPVAEPEPWRPLSAKDLAEHEAAMHSNAALEREVALDRAARTDRQEAADIAERARQAAKRQARIDELIALGLEPHQMEAAIHLGLTVAEIKKAKAVAGAAAEKQGTGGNAGGVRRG